MHCVVMDSGVGGLSVLDHIQRLPLSRLSYIMDNDALPYGDKCPQWLGSRVVEILNTFIKDNPVDICVVACNTASTQFLDKLREQFDFPIVGVVPAIKPAARNGKTEVMALLATEATCSGEYVDALIQRYAADCYVHKVPAPGLVKGAEQFIRGECSEAELSSLALQISQLHPQPSVVVLGCTHFPLLREQLQALLPAIEFIDSGEAIARRVADLMALSQPGQVQCSALFSTATLDSKQKRALTARFAIPCFADLAI